MAICLAFGNWYLVLKSNGFLIFTFQNKKECQIIRKLQYLEAEAGPQPL